MNDFVEIAQGIWYETATGLPWSSKVSCGRVGIYRYDGELKKLHNSKSNGYYYVKLNGKNIRWHRVVWEYFNGPIQTKLQVDHKFNNKEDNRIENLQLKTHKDNSRKRLKNKNNTSGFTGVNFHKASNKFKAYIRIDDGKRKYLGLFNTPEEAYQAYLEAKVKYHGLESISPLNAG